MDITRETIVRQVALIAFLLTTNYIGFHCYPISTTHNLGVVQTIVGDTMRAINGSLGQLCPVIDYPQEYNESTCCLYADAIVTRYNSEIGSGNMTVNYFRGQSLSIDEVQVILDDSVQHLKLQFKLLATVEDLMYQTSNPGLTLCRQAKTYVLDVFSRPELPSVIGALGSTANISVVVPPSLHPVGDIVNWHLGALKKSLDGFSDLRAALERVRDFIVQSTEQSTSS